MKYLLFVLPVCILLCFQSCKKQDEPPVTSPFSVKYEITATNQTIKNCDLSYVDEDQHLAAVNGLTIIKA